MTPKERLLLAARGELPDRLPFAPRLDLWHNANLRAGTLPAEHRGRTPDQIARAEGWALHKFVPDFANQPAPQALVHRAIGAYDLQEHVFAFVFSPQVGVEVSQSGDETTVVYHLPRGELRTVTVYGEEMKARGVSLPWIKEHLLHGPADYALAASLFENLSLVPRFEPFAALQARAGDDGLQATWFAGGASPVHHIQKYLLDATEFFIHYKTFPREMELLAEALTPLYDQALEVIAASPAEVVNWGGNYDEMITYPPYFAAEFRPWLQKASARLAAAGKLLASHVDGENEGLLDLIRESGIHVAEAVCPHPMTKVRIEDYYRRWADRLTILGGLPSNLLLAKSAGEDEYRAFVDYLFRAVAPGRRFILGVADTVPPGAVFDRLRWLGEKVEREGRLPLAAAPLSLNAARIETREGDSSAPGSGDGALPLAAGALGPLPAEPTARPAPAETTPPALAASRFDQVRRDVLEGRDGAIIGHVEELLSAGLSAGEIVQRGLIAAMEVIGQAFRANTVFIPEVLLSARAMNAAVAFLEPRLAGEKARRGKVLLGTVRGDLHDIGKNLVAAMLRGGGPDRGRPGDQRPGRELRPGRGRAPARRPGPLGPPDHDHAGDGPGGRGPGPGRAA
jgi:hypothetical protein